MANHDTKIPLKKLSNISSWKGICAIFIEWLWIALIIYFYEQIQGANKIIFYPLFMFLMASRQHALAFMVHEGTHYLVTKNKKLNDIVVELFAAWPVFMNLQNYRFNHLTHHRYNNTALDPDWARKQNSQWEFPTSSYKLVQLFVESFLGLHAFKSYQAISGKEGETKGFYKLPQTSMFYRGARISYYLILFSILIYNRIFIEYLLYWILPLLTALQVLNRIRKIAEHFALPSEIKEKLPVDLQTRTVIPTFWEKIFIAPKNIFYHAEHHFYPTIPFYHLPQIHEIINSKKSLTATHPMHVTNSYLGVLRECIKK
jgi:fatty acid desaturase